jgi:DNA-nicking Smr family endonuclease
LVSKIYKPNSKRFTDSGSSQAQLDNISVQLQWIKGIQDQIEFLNDQLSFQIYSGGPTGPSVDAHGQTQQQAKEALEAISKTCKRLDKKISF